MISSDSVKSVHVINVDYRDVAYRKSQLVFSIGKGVQADISIYDKSIDKMHAEILLIGGEFYIRDIGSKHGTYFLEQKPVTFDLNSYKNMNISIPNHIIDINLTNTMNKS